MKTGFHEEPIVTFFHANLRLETTYFIISFLVNPLHPCGTHIWSRGAASVQSNDERGKARIVAVGRESPARSLAHARARQPNFQGPANACTPTPSRPRQTC